MALTMILYDKKITPELCNDLKRVLKTPEDLTRSESITTGPYAVHRWVVTVIDLEAFKRAVVRFPNSHEGVGLYADAIQHEADPASGKSNVWHYLGRLSEATRFALLLSRLGVG